MKQLRSIEALLRCWEDACLIHCADAFLRGQASPYQQHIASWADMRPELYAHLKRIESLDLDVPAEYDQATSLAVAFDRHITQKFFGGNVQSFATNFSPFKHSHVGDVLMWASAGGFVYDVSAETHAMLNMSNLADLRWKDVPWPTNSFMLAFEAPLVGTRLRLENGKSVEDPYKYDGIMVWYSDAVHPVTGQRLNAVVLRLLSARSRNSFMSLDLRAQLVAALAAKDRKKVTALVAQARTHQQHMGDSRMIMPADVLGNQPIADSIQEFVLGNHPDSCRCGGTHPEWNQAAVLVAKLCHYVSIAPASDPFVSQWMQPKVPTGMHPLNIAQFAAVARVHCKLQLTGQQRKSMIERGEMFDAKMIDGHTRGWHFRRPAGKGGDPDWPRTEFVLPCCPNIEKTEGEQRKALDAWLEAAMAQALHIREQHRKKLREEKESAPAEPARATQDAHEAQPAADAAAV